MDDLFTRRDKNGETYAAWVTRAAKRNGKIKLNFGNKYEQKQEEQEPTHPLTPYQSSIRYHPLCDPFDPVRYTRTGAFGSWWAKALPMLEGDLVDQGKKYARLKGDWRAGLDWSDWKTGKTKKAEATRIKGVRSADFVQSDRSRVWTPRKWDDAMFFVLDCYRFGQEKMRIKKPHLPVRSPVDVVVDVDGDIAKAGDRAITLNESHRVEDLAALVFEQIPGRINGLIRYEIALRKAKMALFVYERPIF